MDGLCPGCAPAATVFWERWERNSSFQHASIWGQQTSCFICVVRLVSGMYRQHPWRFCSKAWACMPCQRRWLATMSRGPKVQCFARHRHSRHRLQPSFQRKKKRSGQGSGGGHKMRPAGLLPPSDQCLRRGVPQRRNSSRRIQKSAGADWGRITTVATEWSQHSPAARGAIAPCMVRSELRAKPFYPAFGIP